MSNPKLHETILTLYRGCCDRSAPDFKEWAMETVCRTVPFDSGIWVTAEVISERFRSAYLYKQPPEMMANYDKVMGISGDFLAQAVVTHPGRTINSGDVMPRHDFIRQPVYLQHCRHYGMEYGLSTCHVLPVTGIVTCIAFYRADPDAPFSESERQSTELLIPHMIEALRINLFFYMRGSNAQEDRALAICDSTGTLYETTPRFPDVLHSVWPTWKGPRLQLPFESLNGQGRVRWSSDGLSFEASPCQDLFLLSVARVDVLDRLTPRQTEVAQLLVNGKTYKSIGRELTISTSTVTKHVNEIHARLQIDGREALIDLFRQRQSMMQG